MASLDSELENNTLIESKELSKEKVEPFYKVLKPMVPVLASVVLSLANQASGQTGFSGFVRDAANGISSDSALVTLVNPANNPITTRVGRLLDDYWTRTTSAGWINVGDTCKIYVQDTTGQQASTIKIVTGATNYVSTLFCGGHAFLIPSVWDTVDSINVKCYSKGPTVWSDTLQGRFRRDIPHDDVYFNREKFVRKPALNDSVVFEISQGSYFARTALKYQRALWDADTAASCSLKIVGIGEDLEQKVEKLHPKLIVSPTLVRDHVDINKSGKIYLYNATGNLVKKVHGNKIDVKGLPVGTYFVFVKEDDKKLLFEPKKIIVLE